MTGTEADRQRGSGSVVPAVHPTTNHAKLPNSIAGLSPRTAPQSSTTARTEPLPASAGGAATASAGAVAAPLLPLPPRPCERGFPAAAAVLPAASHHLLHRPHHRSGAAFSALQCVPLTDAAVFCRNCNCCCCVQWTGWHSVWIGVHHVGSSRFYFCLFYNRRRVRPGFVLGGFYLGARHPIVSW